MGTVALDIARFAKVRALHDSTTHSGERAAAADRMSALAEAAGMTVEQATAQMVRHSASISARRQAEEEFLDAPFGVP
jgi:hypothetical protein